MDHLLLRKHHQVETFNASSCCAREALANSFALQAFNLVALANAHESNNNDNKIFAVFFPALFAIDALGL